MNLSSSLGLGAVESAAVRLERPPLIRSAKRTYSRSDLERMFRFVAWSTQLERFPTVTQIQAHFGVCVATAYRWRSALAAAYGITAPKLQPGEGGNRVQPSRRVSRSGRQQPLESQTVWKPTSHASQAANSSTGESA